MERTLIFLSLQVNLVSWVLVDRKFFFYQICWLLLFSINRTQTIITSSAIIISSFFPMSTLLKYLNSKVQPSHKTAAVQRSYTNCLEIEYTRCHQKTIKLSQSPVQADNSKKYEREQKMKVNILTSSARENLNFRKH